MRVAPHAQTDDGILDITIIGKMSLPEILWHFPRLYSGRIGKAKKVTFKVGKRVEAWSNETVLLDVDGESPGRLPVVIEILPKAIMLMVANPQKLT
jgi:diacylglycerol kinase family enzyme